MKFIPDKVIEVPDIPFKDIVHLPAAQTAVVVVDMQNDFVKPGGQLVVPAAIETVPAIRHLLETARGRGVRVVYTMDTHFENDPEWKIWGEHCRYRSWGWEVIEELRPADDDLIVQKNRYDGFYGTWLDHMLRVWGVHHLVLVGTMSNVCVLHTAASAGLRWYHIVVPADGISTITDFDQAATLRQVSWLYVGDVVRRTQDVRFDG
ncbi:MAG: cysteine hydrolase [Acidobacteria bacterium]|nr:cysteine hydrolase [Acidobacteriota bacterium]MDW7983383.1 isochorismatase family cysteine hydrolase [Acidobacteriota bacterium]